MFYTQELFNARSINKGIIALVFPVLPSAKLRGVWLLLSFVSIFASRTSNSCAGSVLFFFVA